MSANLMLRTILVTRPAPAGMALCALLEEKGARAIFFPTIAFAPMETADLERGLAALHQQAVCIFISPQAVYQAFAALNMRGQLLPAQLTIVAMGEGTAAALQAMGVNHIIYPSTWNSESLLALPQFQAVKNQKITIVRGAGGREVVDHVLRERGAIVTSLIVYQRTLPTVSPDAISVLHEQKIEAIVATSFDCVRNLTLLLSSPSFQFIYHLPLLVVSERIKRLAHDLGFQTIWMADAATNEALLARLLPMLPQQNSPIS